MEESNNLAIIVLAAGKGKRMKNPNLPKVLVELNHKPLIQYVLDEVLKLKFQKLLVVVGHLKELVINFIISQYSSNFIFVEQKEQLGTGHAVLQTYPYLIDFSGSILILSGDVPLIKSETLTNFIKQHFESKSDISVLSTLAPEPKGYGRILRDKANHFVGIVEEKDCNEEQKEINEINSGIYLVNSKLLFSALQKLDNNNAQQEYYLTDIVSILQKEGKNCNAFLLASFDELQGINSYEELFEIENKLKNEVLNV